MAGSGQGRSYEEHSLQRYGTCSSVGLLRRCGIAADLHLEDLKESQASREVVILLDFTASHPGGRILHRHCCEDVISCFCCYDCLIATHPLFDGLEMRMRTGIMVQEVPINSIAIKKWFSSQG